MEPFAEEQVRIDVIQAGDSLAIIDDNGRRVLFQVENKRWHTVRQDNGTFRTTHTIESEPLPDTGEPWRIEYPAGTIVTRIHRIH